MKIKNLIIIFLFLNISKLLCYEKFVIGQHSPSGFFSIFFNALNKIYWCKKNNKIPVIYWGKDCLYYQPSGYNGSYNVWEYYFEPVSNLTYNQKDKINILYAAPDGFAISYGKDCYNKNFHNLKFILNKIVKEYIHIKPIIKSKIRIFYRKFMQNQINIGIHLRGTDKIYEAKQVNLNFIFNKANDIAKNLKTDYQFFVATDEEKLLELARSRLNGKVIHYDCHRSINGKPIHHSKKDKAILGEEILIDAQLLSKCDYFLHTRSNVATSVMVFNPNIRNIFFEN